MPAHMEGRKRFGTSGGGSLLPLRFSSGIVGREGGGVCPEVADPSTGIS